jgi:orotate phosphoribosyltransferase-like protein
MVSVIVMNTGLGQPNINMKGGLKMSGVPLKTLITDRISTKIPEVNGVLSSFDRKKPPAGVISITFAVAQKSHFDDFHGIYTDTVINALKRQLDETQKYLVFVEDKNPLFGVYLIPKDSINAN